MAMIEGFRIQNYRALKDIAMGRIGTDTKLRKAKPLTPMTTVIGKNGVGKSSIFDAFVFSRIVCIQTWRLPAMPKTEGVMTNLCLRVLISPCL